MSISIEPVRDRSVWLPHGLHSDTTWVYELAKEEIDAFDAASARVQGQGFAAGGFGLTRDFEQGQGLLLLHGALVDGYELSVNCSGGGLHWLGGRESVPDRFPRPLSPLCGRRQ